MEAAVLDERVFNVLERKRRKRREKERERKRERERNEGIDACFVQVVAWYKNILDTVLTTRSPTLDSWTFISRILNDYTRSREIRVENRSRKGTILQEISSLAVIRYYYLSLENNSRIILVFHPVCRIRTRYDVHLRSNGNIPGLRIK